MCDIACMGQREVTFADLARRPDEVAHDLVAWQRGDHDDAIAQTLAASARETHGRAMTLWAWSGATVDGTPAWILPITTAHAQSFSPPAPARVLVMAIGAAVDVGADSEMLMCGDWHGWTVLIARGADPDLFGLALGERLPDAARIAITPLPHPLQEVAEIDLGRARGQSGIAVLGHAVGAHPVEVAIALAAHGQPLDIDARDPDMERNLRNWGLSGDPLPDDDDELGNGIDDDPCPRRRHARRMLQRLLRMGKVGRNYHTAIDHLSRGVPADQRHDALMVIEALLRAGLLGEKRNVGQRHIFLRRDALPDIHALMTRGITSDPILAAIWTAPAPPQLRD